MALSNCVYIMIKYMKNSKRRSERIGEIILSLKSGTYN